MRFLFVALLVLCCQGAVYARVPFADLTALLQSAPDNDMTALVRQMQDPEANEQKLMKQFFELPFEYRQYVFPALHETRSISYKTRTMPGVIEWRGKVPTRLAPEVQELTEEDLRYLSPFMYPYLMPEMWPSFYENKDVPQKQVLAQEVSLDNKSFFKVYSPKYRTLEERGIYPLKPRPEAVGDLSKEDVGKVMTVIDSFKRFGSGKDGEERMIHVALALPRTAVFDAMENPCASLVDRMYQTGHSVFVEDELHQVHMTRGEFTDKCDRVIKAFRVAKTAPTVVQDVLQKKKAYLLVGNYLDPMIRQAWKTTIAMFETTAADVDAVKDQMPALDDLFRPRYFMLGTPLLLDF